ncbi:Gfo/Idh/MocA family protein [Salinimonas marina]|uniref:Gfo/Idh/MocA family protein n=1 Tax=Salinimonas marina TaxID=2785918 RepID=UPI001C553067|nr:Gfo/Idh/MocA family oxidoreductase [Salinimonas marina]
MFAFATNAQEKLNIGVVGLTHTHVHWIFESQKRGDFVISGIVEPDKALARRYAKRHDFSMELVYPDMATMLDKTRPEALAAFGSIAEHLEVVQTAAPRGIHVMVEKPLALNMNQARQMYQLATQHQIHLLTNYETTWYPTNHRVKQQLDNDAVGPVRKVIVRDGHKGPVKLDINSEFLDWLLDPAQSGGGALMDFGCYGANLMTWLKNGQMPTHVTAITEQLQPDNHQDVEDEATIILSYPDNRTQFRQRTARDYDDFDQTRVILKERPYPYDDPFSYLKAVIEGRITPALMIFRLWKIICGSCKFWMQLAAVPAAVSGYHLNRCRSLTCKPLKPAVGDACGSGGRVLCWPC